MKYLYGILSALILTLSLVSASSATPRRATEAAPAYHNEMDGGRVTYYNASDTQTYNKKGKRIRTDYNAGSTYADGEGIVDHPTGCPRRLFCACGVSMKIWGHAKHMAAKAFFQYPRASPGSGMVAVRNHHVMYIMAYNGDNMATVYDPNSGGRQTRIHQRSLAGYSVRNPNA